MKTNRPLVRLAALGTAASLGLVAAPAMAARPVKPGVVTNMTFTATAPAYHLASTWSAGKYATAYQVKLTNAAGTVLDNEKVTTTGWSLDVTTKQAPLGSVVKLAVTSLNGKQKSATVSRTLTMPDVTPPTGSYSAVVNGYTATLTQDSLSDDSGAANVSRSIDWGDGTAAQAWSAQPQHVYAKVGSYTITVTLKDQAGNTAVEKTKANVVDNPPTGTFTVQWDNSTGAATVDAVVKDDITPSSAITGTIDWKDGSPVDSFTGSGTLAHTYAKTAARYVPTVVLTDDHGYTTTYQTPAIVINDTAAPTGTFVLNRSTAWAKYTKVVLSQTAIHDDWSPDANIKRTVDWGDGDVQQWTAGTTLTHVYRSAGSYAPKVTLTDEAGNATDPAVSAGAVTVKADTAAPRVTIKLPARPRNVIKKWRTLRGTARDAGVGVKVVHLQVVEKRGTTYYAYKWSTKRWVKVGHRLGRAWTKAGTASLRPSATHTWAKSVARLRKGVLVFRVNGVDRVNNTSRWLVHSQKLTR